MILGTVISVLCGIACIVFGIIHTTGNINSLHSYHRDNVKEEDKKPFGRRVGAGTITIGASLVIYGVLMLLSELLAVPVLTTVALIIMLVG
ncbi:MAG: hypothetical protein J6C61_07955, partial [Clostridia bacterium]|nr:hypothetical protein [Clostridia bacterium]